MCSVFVNVFISFVIWKHTKREKLEVLVQIVCLFIYPMLVACATALVIALVSLAKYHSRRNREKQTSCVCVRPTNQSVNTTTHSLIRYGNNNNTWLR